MSRILTVAVTDEDGTVLDSFESEIEDIGNDLQLARAAITDVAEKIRFGVA